MFATVFRMQAKPGQEQHLLEVDEAWKRERQPQVEGFLSSYVIQSVTRPGEVWGITIFDSEENFRKNAADPEQDQWYRRFRYYLEADPEWNDGPVISVSHQSQKEAMK